jgi:hypothetical protein
MLRGQTVAATNSYRLFWFVHVPEAYTKRAGGCAPHYSSTAALFMSADADYIADRASGTRDAFRIPVRLSNALGLSIAPAQPESWRASYI